jgi:hypothetical protein
VAFYIPGFIDTEIMVDHLPMVIALTLACHAIIFLTLQKAGWKYGLAYYLVYGFVFLTFRKLGGYHWGLWYVLLFYPMLASIFYRCYQRLREKEWQKAFLPFVMIAAMHIAYNFIPALAFCGKFRLRLDEYQEAVKYIYQHREDILQKQKNPRYEIKKYQHLGNPYYRYRTYSNGWAYSDKIEFDLIVFKNEYHNLAYYFFPKNNSFSVCGIKGWELEAYY